MKLDQLAKVVLKAANDMIASGEQLVPVCFFERRGDMGVVMMPWETEEEKIAALASLRGLIAGADSYLLVTEAWFKVCYTEEDMRVRPSDSEIRDECVSLIGFTRAGECFYGTAPILRDPSRIGSLVSYTERPGGALADNFLH